MKHNKSFTLIELLVVIAIIGLLSSIVLVSLRSARGKATIATGLQFSQSVLHGLGSEAVGIWEFDEGTGTTAGDRSGYGNNGTITGATWRCASTDSGYTPSGDGCSLEFDGINDYINCGNDASLNITNAITIEAWVKPYTNLSSGIQSVSRRDISSHYALGGGWSSSKWRFYVKTTTDWFQSGDSTTTIQKDNWYHIVGTYDKDAEVNNLKLYVNGKLESQNTATGAMVINGNVMIGKYSTTDYFKGLIDEVRIYSKALSAGEIKKHYVEGLKQHSLVSGE